MMQAGMGGGWGGVGGGVGGWGGGLIGIVVIKIVALNQWSYPIRVILSRVISKAVGESSSPTSPKQIPSSMLKRLAFFH
jgi:hypothetical protein